METKSYKITYTSDYEGVRMPWSVYRNNRWFASYHTEQEAIDCVVMNINMDMHYDIKGNRIAETEKATGAKL